MAEPACRRGNGRRHLRRTSWVSDRHEVWLAPVRNAHCSGSTSTWVITLFSRVFRLEFLIMLIGLIPIFLKLHLPTDVRSTPALSKEFDLAGTISLLFSVALPLVAVNVGGKIVPWSHPVCLTLLVCTPFALGAFYFFEKRATTPVFRLELFKHRPVMSIMACTFSIIYMFNAVSLDPSNADGEWSRHS